MSDAQAALTRINLDDLVGAFGWRDRPRLARFASLLFHSPARLFARQILDFDSTLRDVGLVEASRRVQRLHVRDLRVYGRERLPTGPLLIVSNHPGLTDTLALFTAVGRPDLKIIALQRPFLASLPNVSRHLLFLPAHPQARMALVRQVAEHLRAGGAVLTFPAGHTEPDPAVYPGAAESLRSWIDSATIFLRLAPETVILPACVRGVTWDRTAHHFVPRLRRLESDRQLLASAMQMLLAVLLKKRPVAVRVEFGRPIRSTQGDAARGQGLHAAVIAEMQRLIENPPSGGGTQVL